MACDSSVLNLQGSCKKHTDVVERFGRYPHRNRAMGREDTAEEAEWLADWENLPGWARSQLPRPAGK